MSFQIEILQSQIVELQSQLDKAHFQKSFMDEIVVELQKKYEALLVESGSLREKNAILSKKEKSKSSVKKGSNVDQKTCEKDINNGYPFKKIEEKETKITKLKWSQVPLDEEILKTNFDSLTRLEREDFLKFEETLLGFLKLERVDDFMGVGKNRMMMDFINPTKLCIDKDSDLAVSIKTQNIYIKVDCKQFYDRAAYFKKFGENPLIDFAAVFNARSKERNEKDCWYELTLCGIPNTAKIIKNTSK